jgi:hypothetical protein
VLTAKTHEQFATGLPKIGRLIDEGTIQCIPHAFNKRRLNLSGDNAFISRLTRNTPWITLGRLTGETREILKSKRRHMRKALSRHFKVMHFGRTKIGVLEKTARLLNMPEQNSAIKILNKFFDIFSGKPSYLIMPLKINTPLPNLLFSPLTLLPVWLQGRHSSVFGTRSMSEIA